MDERQAFMDFSDKAIAPLDVYVEPLELTGGSARYWVFWLFEFIIVCLMAVFYYYLGKIGFT